MFKPFVVGGYPRGRAAPAHPTSSTIGIAASCRLFPPFESLLSPSLQERSPPASWVHSRRRRRNRSGLRPWPRPRGVRRPSRSMGGSMRRRGARRRRSPSSGRLGPRRARPPRSATEVRVLFDDDALYIGARMKEPMGPAGSRPAGATRPAARVERQQRIVQLADDGQDRDRHRSVSQPHRRGVVRDEPGRRARRPVQWRPVVGSGVGGRVARGGRGGGRPRCASRTRSSASGATACRRGGCRCGAYVDRLNEQDMWSYRRRDEGERARLLRHRRDSPSRISRDRRSCCRTSCRAGSSSTRRRAIRTAARAR